MPSPRVAPPAFVRDLSALVRGEVRFDAGTRATYSTDASNYRQIPLGVVIPRDAEDVRATVALCRAHGVPITSRGGGTSLAGQSCNVGVILDHSKYFNRVLSIDGTARTAQVEPGCVLDDLRKAATERAGLTFGPDPATHNRNTLGGMIGNNSCGIHSVLSACYGPGPLTRHQVLELDVLTYDGQRFKVGPTPERELAGIISLGGRRGEIYAGLARLRDRYGDEIRKRYPSIPRRVSGYNLDALLPEQGFNVAAALVGTEGTCVVVLGATLRLIDPRPERVLVVLGYPDVYRAADHVPEIMERRPVGLEGLDDELIEYLKKKHRREEDIRMLPEGKGWLLVEFGADGRDEALEQARGMMRDLQTTRNPPSMKLFDDPGQAARLWEVRESGLGATAHVPGLGRTHPGWEDSAVPPASLGAYLREFRSLLEEFGYHAALYGHFGQGCLHCRIDFDLATESGVQKWKEFLERAADLVLRHGGSFSGEHGDGQARGWLLPRMYGADLVNAFREFKALWDPEWKMNPGKVVDPLPVDHDLREGPNAQRPDPKTWFGFARDQGSFFGAAARCVGVGECRRTHQGTMCPSYMVTREEKHSTRGRARLLFEMLQGEVIREGWRSPEVREALDLCLACKGCKADCPVQVDMATYKAEFLSHYYQGRLRPRTAYASSLIFWWARLASPLAPLVNALGRNVITGGLAKKVAGFAPERQLPTLARPTLRRWFRNRRPERRGGRGSRVVLWPDTFTNYLRPESGQAAVAVLEHLGYRVELPPRPLCCGRPLYDWGMLRLARRWWTRNLEVLEPYLRAGIPIVGLEPSCVASFRDELPGLFPDRPEARQLSRQTLLLSEFLDREGLELPRVAARALVHRHCHHHAVLGFEPEERILAKVGLDYEILDSGCCGMAGAFGFEREKYEVSVACAERVLLPAIRKADPGTLVIADGFSCREQVRQLLGWEPMHLAEVIALAVEQQETPSDGTGGAITRPRRPPARAPRRKSHAGEAKPR